jgi:hypothetical protein
MKIHSLVLPADMPAPESSRLDREDFRLVSDADYFSSGGEGGPPSIVIVQVAVAILNS